MAVLAPPPARQAPPAAARRDTVSARTAVVLTLAAMTLAALLNADDVDRRARLMAFGWQRSAAVAVTGPMHSLSHALLLDRPRHLLDRALGNEPATRPEPMGPPTPAPTRQPAPTTGPTGTPSAGPSPAPVAPAVRRPTARYPLRVYVGGDSLSQVFGRSLTRIAEATGVVDVTAEFRYSSGLTRPDYFDWPARLRAVVTARPGPEVVVVMFGGNDIQPILTPGGPAGIGTAAWKREYRARVAATMRALTKAGVDVYWIGQPVMRSATFSTRMDVANEIYASEAARHPGVTFVDARPVFADAAGGYATFLPDASGRLVRMRTADGVHFTTAGGDRLATEVLRRIGQRWPLP